MSFSQPAMQNEPQDALGSMFRVYVETSDGNSPSAPSTMKNEEVPPQASRTVHHRVNFPPIQYPSERPECSNASTTWSSKTRTLRSRKERAWQRVYSEVSLKTRPCDSASTASSWKSEWESDSISRQLRKRSIRCRDSPHQTLRSNRENQRDSKPVWTQESAGNHNSNRTILPRLRKEEAVRALVNLPSTGLHLLPPIKEKQLPIYRSYLDRTRERAESLKKNDSRPQDICVAKDSRRIVGYHTNEVDAMSSFSSNIQGSVRSTLTTGISRRSVRLKDPISTSGI